MRDKKHFLKFKNGQYKGRMIELHGLTFTIGRDHSCSHCIDSKKVSRLHAQLTLNNETWTILDCGSINTTILNGIKMTEKPIVLQHLDKIKIGENIFQYIFSEDDSNLITFDPRERLQNLSPAKNIGKQIIVIIIFSLLVLSIFFLLIKMLLNDEKIESIKLADKVEIKSTPESEKLVDKVEIKSTPESEKLVDKVEIKSAPESEKLVDKVEIKSAPESEKLVDKVEIKSAPESQTLEDNEIPQECVFTTEPFGATVFLNGQNLGKTPLIIVDKLLKKNSFQIVLENYINAQGDLNFPEDKANVSVNLKQRIGTVLITSEPNNADVYSDEILLGKTPIFLKNLVNKKNRIKVMHLGYIEQEKEFEYNSLEATLINFKLISDLPSLKIETEPANCSIMVDDIFMGKTVPLVKNGLRGFLTVEGVSVGKVKVDFINGDEEKQTRIINVMKSGEYSVRPVIFKSKKNDSIDD